MNKNLSSILKMLISIGLGVFIIFLVFRNFSKPLKLKLDGREFSTETAWTFNSWKNDSDYVLVGDTLAILTNSSGDSSYLLNIYEGEIASRVAQPEQSVVAGDVMATVKVDIIAITKDAFKRANYWWILLSVVLSLLSHASRAMRWQMMFRPMGYNTKFGNAFGSILIMYLANLAFPRLGEVLRCSVIGRFEKIPIHKSIGTMITERVIDVMCLGIIFLLCLLLQYQVFIDFYNNFMPQKGGNLIKFIILGGGTLILLVTFILYRTGKLPFAHRIREFAQGLWDGIRSIRSLERPWLFVGHSVFIWLMYVLMTAVCLNALPETAPITLLAGLPLLFFGGIAMVAVQGGLGLYPYFISKILVMYGLAETIGYAFGWLMWIGQTVIIIVGGLLAFLLLTIYNKNRL